MKDQHNWWQLSTIQIGGVICLPVIMIGQTLSQNYGFLSSALAILIGNAILLVLSLITVKMSHTNRKTTMQNAEEYFGKRGITFFALAMAVSLTSWFGIQLNMMSLGVLDLFSISENKESWLLFFNVGLGLLITFGAFYGIKGVTFLANLSLPFLILTIAYAAWTLEVTDVVKTHFPVSMAGTSLVIALAIAMVVDLPTYYRHAKTTRDGYISISLIFGLILPALEIVGVYLASGAGEGNILEVFKRGDNSIWNIWVAMFLVLAGWTTNNLNLYSSAISLQSIFKNLSEKNSLILVGLLGTLLSSFDLLSHLELVLDVIGIFIASMGAVVLCRYLLLEYFGLRLSQKDYSRCLYTWCVGIAFGLIGMKWYSITSIALLDAVLGAFVGALLILSRQEAYEKA